MDKHPLSDLTFFRFPELTPEIVRNIVLLALLLVLTVIATVIIQRWLMSRGRHTRRQKVFDRFSSEHHMPQALRELMGKLLRYTEAEDEFELVHDAEAFETAVHIFARTAGEDELADLARLRRMLHLNVMNPELKLVSTRQLMPDMPVRITSSIGSERLDIYCVLLGLDESYLLIDLPHDEEVFTLLRGNPDVYLLFWRERDGETAFPLHLEPLDEGAGRSAGRAGALTVFRAAHVLRERDAFHRENFRLSANLPAEYRYLERTQLSRRIKGQAPLEGPRIVGEGRLIDLGFGGASLVTQQPLGERGFAQIRFVLNEQPLRLMIEILSCTDNGDGSFLVRGQFRGIGEEAHARLQNILTHEQMKRLRAKTLVHISPEDWQEREGES